MGFFSTRASLLNTFFLLSQIVSQVQSYAIDQSCESYATDNKDKRAMVRASMAEANSMATLGRDKIMDWDMFDNSKMLLFPFGVDADFQVVKDRYQTLLDTIPWTESQGNSLTADKVTIYCGDANFAAWNTEDSTSMSWMDLTSSYVFTGPPHGGDEKAGLCGSGAIAQTLNHGHIENPTSNPGESDIQVLILCDPALVRGSAMDTTESRATLQDLYDAGELFYGRAITNIGYQHTLSWTVLHELFHAAMTNIMAKGAAEIYGWDPCLMATIDQAKVNCDTYAYMGMVFKVEDIDNDLMFTNGWIGSRQAAFQAAMQNFNSQPQPIWGTGNP